MFKLKPDWLIAPPSNDLFENTTQLWNLFNNSLKCASAPDVQEYFYMKFITRAPKNFCAKKNLMKNISKLSLSNNSHKGDFVFKLFNPNAWGGSHQKFDFVVQSIPSFEGRDTN